MKNFKEIAEKCLAGELNGTFILHNGEKKHVSKKNQTICKDYLDPYSPYIIGNRKYSRCGVILPISNAENPYDIIDFIPDNMEKLIKIDIPEGRIPVVEQIENGVVITWKEKELTYEGIKDKLSNDRKYIGNFGYNTMSPNLDTQAFYRKMGVLHKLVNIRNYFGKPGLHDTGWFIMSVWPEYNRFGAIESIEHSKCPETVIFKEKEHAEQAIKMLGDELKYLFEPW